MTTLDLILTSSRLPLNAKLTNVKRVGYYLVIETVAEYLARVLTYERPLGVDVTIVSPPGIILLQDVVSEMSDRTYTKYRFNGGIEDADFTSYSSDVSLHESTYNHTSIAQYSDFEVYNWFLM